MDRKTKLLYIIVFLIFQFTLLKTKAFPAVMQKKVYFKKFSHKSSIDDEQILKFINDFSFKISTIISNEHDVFFTGKDILKSQLLKNNYEFKIQGRFIIGFKTFLIEYSIVHIKNNEIILKDKIKVVSLKKDRPKIIKIIAEKLVNSINNYKYNEPKFVSITPINGEYNKPINVKFITKNQDGIVRYSISFSNTPPNDPDKESPEITTKGLVINKNAVVKFRVFSKYGFPGQIITRKYNFKPFDIKLSHHSGTYKKDILVKITGNPSGGKVYYTFSQLNEKTDIPDEKSIPFPEKGAVVNRSAVLKLVVIKPGWTKGNIQTYKYSIKKKVIITKKPEPKKEPQKYQPKNQFKDAINLNFSGGYPVQAWAGLEIKIYGVLRFNFRVAFSTDEEPSSTNYYISMPIMMFLNIYFSNSARVRPYISIGLGYLYMIEGKAPDNPLFYLAFGGFDIYLSRKISFFAEAGGYKHDQYEFCASGGFKFYF